MSNEVATIEKYHALAVMGEKTDLVALAEQNLGGGDRLTHSDIPQAKVGAGGSTLFTMPSIDGEHEAEKTIEGVVVYHHQIRSFYPEAGAQKGLFPACWSHDAKTCETNPEGEERWKQIKPPAGLPTLDAETCPNSKWDTATGMNGQPTKGQACGLRRRIYILTPDSLLPILLVAPPASVGNVRQYFLGLFTRGISYRSVLSRFSLEKAESAEDFEYARIRVSMAGRLPQDQFEKIDAYGIGFERLLGAIAGGAESFTESA